MVIFYLVTVGWSGNRQAFRVLIARRRTVSCEVQEEWNKPKQEPEAAQAQPKPQQPQTEWVRYKTPDGQVYYHNETTNHTAIPSSCQKRHPVMRFNSQFAVSNTN